MVMWTGRIPIQLAGDLKQGIPESADCHGGSLRHPAGELPSADRLIENQVTLGGFP
jgi:hypothetical protein